VILVIECSAENKDENGKVISVISQSITFTVPVKAVQDVVFNWPDIEEKELTVEEELMPLVEEGVN
jgi:hypothetical protein